MINLTKIALVRAAESTPYNLGVPSDTLISHTLESSFGKWGVTSEFLEQSRQYLQTQTGIVPDVHNHN